MADKSNLEIHRRCSLRLKGYDYSQEGAYFVTVCTQHKVCHFGDIVDGEVRLNNVGRMIESAWNDLPQYYPDVAIDAFVVMPNHIHGIIILTVGAGPRACPMDPRARPHKGQPQGVAPTTSLPDVVHRFKSLTTTRYRQGVHREGWRPFAGRLWQRNYYEHVIRNEEDLNRIREYIADNPALWAEDENNLARLDKASRPQPEGHRV